MSADHGSDGTHESPGGTGLAILLALVIFALSAVAYPVALATGADVTWAIGSNTAAAVAIVAWTARRTFSDPASSVGSVPGAVGTALLVLGGYGLLVAGVLALTARWHDAGGLVGPLAALALVAGAFGLATFAFEVVFAESAGTGQPPDGDAGGPDEHE